MSDVLYQPSAEQRAASQLTQFAKHLQSHSQQSFPDYQALHAYSISELDAFWKSVWEFGQVQGDAGDKILADAQMPGAQWFPEATLNFAENLLSQGKNTDTALINLSESRGETTLTYAELKRQVQQLAAYLHDECGVKAGDRVCAYLGNTPEAVIGMLATTWLGAIWSSASPDFGLEGAQDRFSQIEPVVLIAGNGYRYGGKNFDRSEVVTRLREGIPSVRQVISVDVLPDQPTLPDSERFEDIVAGERGPIMPMRLPFDQPVYILFSSGTTGKPKCIVHGAGGTLLQHIKELRLHGDVNHDSVFFYFTTTGWMMWNWLASGLVTGAAVVLYDGNPMHPQHNVLWKYAEKYRFTHFGTSAKYLSACRKMGVKTPALPSLKVIFSTGSPLAPEDFDWVYEQIKHDVLLHSISGGTDIVSCFVGGNPWLPVRRGKIQAPNLGMAVEAWDEHGQSVLNQRGELVCTKPAPCMPVGFWNDPDKVRYTAAYFERFPGIWAHGDFCSIDDDGQVVILGRSDTTLNPGGVRIGTAEIYRQVELLEDIADSLVVGRQTADDVEVVLFVVMKDGAPLDDEMIQTIRTCIRSNTTPRHVPKHILAVSAIPYTRSGKKVELAVTEIMRGDMPKNLSALANADVLDEYRELSATL